MKSGIRRTRIIHGALIVVAALLSLFLAYQIRFEFNLPTEPVNWEARMWHTMKWILPLEYIVFYALGLFSPLVARFSWWDFCRVGTAVALLSGFLLYLWFIFSGDKTAPRSVIFINGLFLFTTLCSIMALSAHLRHILTGNLSELPVRASRVVSVGTGFLAYQLIEQTRSRRGLGMRVVGVVDSRGRFRDGQHWQGAPVGGGIDQLESVCRRFDPDRIIITDPELPAEQVRQLVWKCRRLHVPLFIVPSTQEMPNGVLRVEEIRPVGLDDVLGRNSLDIDLPRIHRLLSGKRVLVTGAGGSIGSELSRQILAMGPSKLLLLDSSEPSLFQIEQRLRKEDNGSCVNAVLADVRDLSAMHTVFQNETPEVIFHSAALKHVPMMEMYPGEGLQTNTLGTHQLAELAEKFGAERMVFISTDKAINPTSLMGASKRLAEQLIQARPRDKGGPAFLAVRFGNVIGSSGSVVPIFEKQIAAGGPVTVTHADVTRYFMSIPEAVGLVLQSATQGSGGEIFMLDMGEPLKVLDIARLMIEMRGLEPDKDIAVKIIGLRPGEKLFEELSYDAEIHDHTTHPRVYRLTAPPLTAEEAARLMASIQDAINLRDANAIREAVRIILPEFIAPETDKDSEVSAAIQA
ncbi:polysaccharide biosynthesis protein [Cerasicoccus fimbriatus]|uniref:polysaccharide biosynthesis protein n=1 Tax=Cerasicoccus fimbriatus TaxID=3014554 RepID=UPI0022B39BDC|nr:nucleoside-diphosphate sugar epimerase/dehydratase [Cerasicoccus sp. TK19100]